MFVYGVQYVLMLFFNFVLVYNCGVVFGFLLIVSGWQCWVFIVFGVGVMFVICFLLKCYGYQWLFSVLFVLIFGGVFGNVIDWLVYGYVIDFFDFYFGVWYFLVFNFVDFVIMIGVVLLIYDELWCVCGLC